MARKALWQTRVSVPINSEVPVHSVFAHLSIWSREPKYCSKAIEVLSNYGPKDIVVLRVLEARGRIVVDRASQIIVAWIKDQHRTKRTSPSLFDSTLVVCRRRQSCVFSEVLCKYILFVYIFWIGVSHDPSVYSSVGVIIPIESSCI